MWIGRLATALGVVVASSGAALAQPGGALFQPVGSFDVFVDGARDEAAQVYQSSAVPAVLIVSGRLPTAVLLHVRSRSAEAVPTARLAPQGAALRLLRGDPLDALGSFEVEGAVVVVRHGQQEVRLQPSPALVGERRIEELYEHSPEYRTTADAYVPDEAVLAKLRRVEGEYRVRVVFGSWCSVCKQFLPRGLKVQEALGKSAFRFEYYGLPVEGAWEHPQVKVLEVKSLPTAVVFRGDDVVGRFAGAEGWQSPENELLRAVSGGS